MLWWERLHKSHDIKNKKLEFKFNPNQITPQKLTFTQDFEKLTISPKKYSEEESKEQLEMLNLSRQQIT